MVRPVVAVSLLLLAALLAGCVDDDDPLQGDGSQVGPPGVSGRIVDTNLDPVGNVTVIFTQDAEWIHETTSDENGEYLASPLPEGAIRIDLVHTCCHVQSSMVQIEGNGTHRHDVMLEPLPSKEPTQQSDEWNGFISCGVTLLFPLSNDCGDPNHNLTHVFEVHQGLASLVVAMSWTAPGTGSADDLRLRVERQKPISGWYTYADRSASSPIEIHINSTGHDEHDFVHIEEEPWTLRFTVRTADNLGYAYQQPFTVWYRMHYWEEADEGASALPDQ